MNEDELKRRTKQFALRVMKLVNALPNTVAGRAIAAQLVRAGTSVGSNYRAACRGRSRAEFVAKLGTVLEEADESAYWLELIMEGGLLKIEAELRQLGPSHPWAGRYKFGTGFTAMSVMLAPKSSFVLDWA